MEGFQANVSTRVWRKDGRIYPMPSVPSTRAALARSARLVTQTPGVREALPLLAFASTYAASYLYGNRLSSPAPLWPPDAVQLCALLLTAPQRWGRLLLIVICIRLLPWLAPGVPFPLLLLYLFSDLLKALGAVVLLRRVGGEYFRFDSLRSIGVYI